MKNIGYRRSLQWLIDNDDTEFMRDSDGVLSVTLCLVADIFGVDQYKVRDDLGRMLLRQGYASYWPQP